ncbi:MAG: 4a-hydroxytetrahydrobiopterin dehydratase [Gammaproteobacteria bacterium]
MTGRQPLSPEEAKGRMRDLPSPWRMSGGKLIGKWQTNDFGDVQKLVRAVMRIAAAEDHHPEVVFGWNTVRVVFRTHRPPGLSEKDFYCAGKLSRAAARIR